MSEHEESQRDLGSYLLGALDPAERTAVQVHLSTCGACREELASYAGVPGLLGRLARDEVLSETLFPPASLLPSVLAAVEAERGSRQSRLRRWQVAAGTAALAAAAGLVLAVGLPGSSPAGAPLVAAAGVVASGNLVLQDRPWGSALHLRLRLPPAASYAAWTVDAAGHRTLAATWGRPPDGRVRVDGATALHRGSVRQVLVTDEAQHTLLALRL